MRFESSVTSVSWIPSEALTGLFKLPFDLGIGHYDDPPPDVLDDLEALQAAHRFRFANQLRAWVEVSDGRITDHGQSGAGHMGVTIARLGPKAVTFTAVALPTIQPSPEVGDGWVRFQQTNGGRTGAPMPRRVARPPFVQVTSPTAWTTLALTIHADGSAERELVGASSFPRHWVYDADGTLMAKSGLIDYKDSPWGEEDSPAVVAKVESALERELSTAIMRGGAKPRMRKVSAGQTLVEQGEEGHELFLLLDGVLRIEVDGEAIAEVGPGALLGERAILEGGRRTSTMVAVTPCRVAVASAEQVDTEALAAVADQHRREDG
jgi:hypothetical protein